MNRCVSLAHIVILTVLIASVSCCKLGLGDQVFPADGGEVSSLFKPVLRGPEIAAVGELVILDATDSTGVEQYRWIAVTHPGPLYIDTSGTKAVFSAREPGTYKFVLATAGRVKDEICLEQVLHTVEVTRDPGPGPGPGPDPPPRPPGPSKYGLLELAYQFAKKVNDPDGAQKMADTFEVVSSRISAGTYNSVNAAMQDMRARNQEALTASQIRAWTKFRDELQKSFETLARQGKLRTLPDHAEAFLEIAKGLKDAR